MKFSLLFFFNFLLIFTSCTDPNKDEDLKKRELTLINKEQEFAAKQKDYEELKMMRDSLQSLSDTTLVAKVPEKILGRWNGKMICTESNCSDYVIGDLRNDIWEFKTDSVKITNKSGGERWYSLQVIGSELRINSDIEPLNNNKTEIILQLPTENSDRMKGNREIVRENCTSKFSVDLERIKK